MVGALVVFEGVHLARVAAANSGDRVARQLPVRRRHKTPSLALDTQG